MQYMVTKADLHSLISLVDTMYCCVMCRSLPGPETFGAGLAGDGLRDGRHSVHYHILFVAVPKAPSSKPQAQQVLS